MKKIIILFLTFMGLLFSCSKDETENINIGTQQNQQPINDFTKIISIENKKTINKLEFRNEKNGERFGVGSRMIDIFSNNNLLVKDFPFSCYEECNYPEYSFTGNKIFNKGGYGEGGGGFIDYIEYNLDSKKFAGYSSTYSNYLVYEKYITNVTENPKGFGIYTYYTFDKDINEYSVFSMTMTGSVRKNYIYDSKLKFETKEDFSVIKEQYKYLLGGKEIILNFKDLENSQEKMPFLYGGGNENENFNYNIYLEKQDSKFTINFKYIKDLFFGEHKKTVKNIGVISCSGNNSKDYDKEYILQIKDKDGNYKYNINEKFGNKCDIPYKINVYYTDGTKETGEYYVLFNY